MARAIRVGLGVAAEQHVPEGRARVEPDLQDVGALGVAGGVIAGLVEDVFHRRTAPSLDAAFFNNGGRLVQDGHGAWVQFAAVFVQKERYGHTPAALARDAPVGAVGDHVAQAAAAVLGVKGGLVDGVQGQLAQGLGGFVFGKDAFALVHAHEPLRRGAVDHRRFVAPAVRVAVGDAHRGHQAAVLAQGLDDDGAGFPDVLAAKERQLVGVHAVALHRVQDVVVGHAVGDTAVEVVHAVGGRGVHDTGAVAVAHVLGQVQRRQASVAVGAAAAVDVVERVAEHLATQGLAFGRGQDGAGRAVALQTLLHQIHAQEQHPFGRVDQRVLEFGVGVERLVGGDGPRGGGPDHRKSGFARGQGGQAKGLGQAARVVRLKGHVQRVALFIGVFDLELGQGRATVKAPVHGFQATVNKAALDDALEGADFAGFVGEVHGAVGALPVAEHAQALEVFALLVDLFGGEGTALGLHVISGELAAMQFFDRVFDRQTMAVPAGDVLRVKARQLFRLDDHVLEDFVERVTDVQLAVGVGRAIVQDEEWCALARGAQLLVQALAVPVLSPLRLALGQVPPHREGRVGHVERGAVRTGGSGRGFFRIRHGGCVSRLWAWRQKMPGHPECLWRCLGSRHPGCRT